MELIRRAIELIRRQKFGKTKISKCDWTEEKDQRLLNAVKLHSINNWREVANHVEGKYSVDCR
jgi:hypothetical protein